MPHHQEIEPYANAKTLHQLKGPQDNLETKHRNPNKFQRSRHYSIETLISQERPTTAVTANEYITNSNGSNKTEEF